MKIIVHSYVHVHRRSFAGDHSCAADLSLFLAASVQQEQNSAATYTVYNSPSAAQITRKRRHPITRQSFEGLA